MKYIYKPEDSLFTSVCLNLTDDCNLACKYCFVQQKPNYMTLDTAKQAIEFLVSNYNKKVSPNKSKIDVTFFGGEPTLQWNQIIVPLVTYVEEKYPNLFLFSITTNGTLLNKERIDFLKEHNIHPLLSIDGCEECQNLNRPCKNGNPSFPLVEKNIPYLLEAFPYTTFRSTIDADTCQYMFDNYLYAESKGFENIFFCPNARTKWTEEQKKELYLQLDKIFLYRLFQFKNKIKPLEFSTINNIFLDILRLDLNNLNNKQDKEANKLPYRCGLGTTSASIGFDGKIFACQEQDSRSTSDIFYIGDIFNGINYEKHKNLLYKYCEKNEIKCETENLCLTCPLFNICNNGSCPSVAYDLFSNFYTKSEIDCCFHIKIFNILCASMKILVEENNPLFKEYLKKVYQEEENNFV